MPRAGRSRNGSVASVAIVSNSPGKGSAWARNTTTFWPAWQGQSSVTDPSAAVTTDTGSRDSRTFASRPGPRVRAAPELLGAIAEALKGPWRLSIAYRGAADTEARERLVEPHGLLLGTRRYLVARRAEGDGRMRHYRLDRIDTARLEPGSFARDPDFDLATHASRAFGSFHAEDEYGEVVWRFSPDAAPTAREFVFHPDQDVTEEEDGALTIRFHASGWLEMAWHLYMWGDAVEVVAPAELREMVEGYRRGDFQALP